MMWIAEESNQIIFCSISASKARNKVRVLSFNNYSKTHKEEGELPEKSEDFSWRKG
jgi:hypothetical protein